jgi:dipeptidyl aminopeptidase/acylaminoacyl peptidase
MPGRFDIERFLNIHRAGGASFSPDGRFVSFLINTTGVAQLWQVPVEGGWPTQLTFTRESVRGGQYNPRRHQILFSMDAGGNERAQLFLLQGTGVTDHALGEGWAIEDISRQPRAVHQFGGWNHEGTAFAFSANRENPGRFDIYVQKPGDRDARLVTRGPGGFYRSAGWSPDDRTLLAHHVESNFNQELSLIDVSKGEVRRLTAAKGYTRYGSPGWSADGKHVYCTSNAGGHDLDGLARLDVSTSKLEWVGTPDHVVEDVVASPKGRWLLWSVNVDGRSVLKLKDLKSGKLHDVPGLPVGVVSGLEFSPDDSLLAFTFNGPRHNPDVWLWDLVIKGKSGPGDRLRQLTRAGRAGIPFDTLVEPELIQYTTFDKRKIPAWWYPPSRRDPGDRRLPPVIVYPHGGPESQTRPSFNALFQFFLQAGYGVLAPNVRGSAGYGTAYLNLDNTTKRMDSVADLAHAAYWLRDEKKADPKRLAVYGGSYGGFMVLSAVTQYPDLWAAGIDVVGIANFVTFLTNTGPYRRTHRAAEYGNLKEHREFLEKISPIKHVDRIRCPMMVIHGANDPRVPIGEAEQIVAALKKRGVPVEYLRYEDEGHGLARLKNRLDAYPKMVAFLNRHLK